MAVLFRVTTVPISLQYLIKGQLPYMKTQGFEPIMISADGAARETVIREQQCQHLVVDMTRKITPFRDLKALWQFYKLCRRYRPEIVHSHTPKAGIIAMLGAKLAGVPIRLHTVAGLYLQESRGLKRTLLTLIEKITYACATKVYPNSSNLRQILLETIYNRPDKLKVIGNGSSNGISSSYFCREEVKEAQLQQIRAELGIEEDDFVYVFVGRFVKDKGMQELVAAFRKLNSRHPKAKLLLVGKLEQDLDPVSEETLEQIENNPAIISAGYQYDVRPYLALSHSLVLPSYREGFPNVPMQAGCMGLPSIVTNINGCNEIIVHEQNGLIIPPKTEKHLLEAMEKMLLDKPLYERMHANARRMIVDRFEQKHLWKLLLKEYQEHLTKHEFVPTIHQTAT